MPATMTIKNFFPSKRYFDRSAGNHREFADDNFVIEWITLATKATAIWCRDHAYMARCQPRTFASARCT